MITYIQHLAATSFYVVLVIYILSELYYNRTYWRLVLRKKRHKRWNLLLWVERFMLLFLGVATIFLTFWKE